MERVSYQQNQAAVAKAFGRGERPDMAATTGCGPLDELVRLHERLGVFAALAAVPIERQRRGMDDALLLGTLAVLPFLEMPSLAAAAGRLCGEPAVLQRPGWSAEQIAWRDNFRHWGTGLLRQAGLVPCHPDTLHDELRRVAAAE